MFRLAGLLVFLLLLLFGGAVWMLDQSPSPSITKPDPATKESRTEDAPKGDSVQDEAREIEKALRGGADQGKDGAPSFDIARIDPNGTSVFAGRAEPRSLVTITADGKEVGTAAVDDNGEWTLTTDARIANPDAKLALFKAPAGSVPRVVGAEPEPPVKSAAAPTAAAKPKTAEAVTSNMLKSLEGMVAEARTEEQRPKAATPAATLPPPPASVAEPATAPAVATLATPSGAPAAAAAPGSSLAAPQTTTVPVPVTFIYNEATLTTDGRKAAALLLEYLRLKRFAKITLTGHADERGSDELNLALSRERLDTVARFLREGGYAGQLDLIARGKAEPYTGVVRGDFSQEDLWQLDRRVELVVSRR
jgi:outer membrane protein OmpA-like peptidoglycan-associated protein